MKTLRDELREMMEERKLSTTAIARSLGVSVAVVSTWLNGKYTGDVAKIDDSVKGFLEREKERLKVPKKRLDFLMTSVAKKVFEIAVICHLDSELGVCYGEAGVGKTRAVQEYARRNHDSILIEADLGYTAKVLFQELCRKLGGETKGSIHDMFEYVVARLKDSGRFIIVDEAEHLPYRALELLRRIYDKAGVGILLVGMPRLIANLRGSKEQYTQLYSRVGLAAKLEGLTAQDMQEIVTSVNPGTNGLWKTYHEIARGNTRVAEKLIFRSIRVANINSVPIDADLVRETSRMLII